MAETGIPKPSDNRGLTLTAKSNAADNAIVTLWADPTTHRLLVNNIYGALGQAAMSASVPVAIASDQSALAIKTNDTVDANNSSTATLLANATFTGTGTDTLGYTSVAVYVYSDQSSAANGVKIEFSSDNVNWNDSTVDTFTAGNAAPNDGQTYLAVVRARYMRIVYTNGAVNQTAFRLNTVLRVGSAFGDIIPVADVPTSVADHAQLVKAAIMGKTTAGGGAWVDVKVNPSGALTVAATAADGDIFVRSANASTFPVNATLSAETTKVIGTVNIASGQTVGLAAGTQVIGHVIVDSGTITTVSAVTAITNALPAGTNLMGKVGIDQTTPGTTNGVSLQNDTTGGWLFSYQSGLTNTAVQIKGTAGKFGGYINLFNPNTATTFIQVFNKASASVTLGVTAPDFVITLPGIAAASGTGSDRNLEVVRGVAMGTGITVAATTSASNATAPANPIVATFLYI